MMKKIIVFILLFTVFQLLIYAEISNNQRVVNNYINWESQEFNIEITNIIPVSEKTLPSLKSIIEKNNNHDLPYIVLSGIQELTINSKTKGKDYIREHSNIIQSILDLAPDFKVKSSVFSLDFKSITTSYSINIYPNIAVLFLNHSRTTKLSTNLNFIPSTVFSGIVIYVNQNLPLYGKQGTGNFSPCLFPKVYNENLDLIIDSLMVNPDIIRESGTVGYQTTHKSLDLARIGNSPLKIKARGLFGINNTDLIISTRDADKILARIENLNLIKQGKILIIYENNN